MAGAASVVGVPNTDNIWLEGLLWGTRWSSGTGRTVVSTYIAGQSGNESVGDGVGGSITALRPHAKELAAMTGAMNSMAAVCNIEFRTVGSKESADLVWASATNADMPFDGVLGWANPPGEGRAYGDHQSAVAINGQLYASGRSSPAFLARGSHDYCTFIHELGHAIGLAHPHDGGGTSTIFPGVERPFGDTGDFGMNQGLWTMMSYNAGWVDGPLGRPPGYEWGYEMGPMALDIAALQRLYGVNTGTRTGDDTYALPGVNAVGTGYLCIWDAGGTDTILGAASRSNTIDLRAATLLAAEGGGGWLSRADGIHGGLTIANGAVIENATGGALADRLTGNEVGNRLRGLAGDDALLGGGGNDVLDGGKGGDTMAGGTGDDVYVVSTTRDAVQELGGQGIDEVRSAVGYTLGPNLENLVLIGSSGIGGTGNALDNRLTGNGNANILRGLDGNDILDGKLGRDVLEGGRGDDIYIAAAGDIIIEELDAGTDEVRSAIGHTLVANLENLVLTGVNAISGTGNGLGNRLEGNSAANLLRGLGGSDSLDGGAGDDRLDGGSGSDQLTGGAGADSFVFLTAAEAGDTITDFGGDDRIEIGAAGFGGGLSAGGALLAEQFQVRADNLAQDDDDRFVFRTTDDTLWFDANGRAEGGLVLVADLQAGAFLTSEQILLVA